MIWDLTLLRKCCVYQQTINEVNGCLFSSPAFSVWNGFHVTHASLERKVAEHDLNFFPLASTSQMLRLHGYHHPEFHEELGTKLNSFMYDRQASILPTEAHGQPLLWFLTHIYALFFNEKWRQYFNIKNRKRNPWIKVKWVRSQRPTSKKEKSSSHKLSSDCHT